jgi:nucleoside-diphosphate-sugar epimerase
MSRKVVITGASGFIGTALVHRFLKDGAEVVATDRLEPKNRLGSARFVRADISDKRQLEGLFDGADVVFHMAAIPSIARAPEERYEASNVIGTENVVCGAAVAGVKRVVHMSSSTVYGIPTTYPISEDAPLQPGCAYSRSKLRAEEAARVSAGTQIDLTIIRPRVVVGPGRAGIFGLLFGFMRLGLPIPLVGGGQNYFQFTSVADLVDACALASLRDHEGGARRTYNIGSKVDRNLRSELEELIAQSGSRSRLISTPTTPVRRLMQGLELVRANPLVEEQYRIADVDFVLDTSRAETELGFLPQHRNCEGLIEAWHWWTAQGGSGLRDIIRWWKPTRQNDLQKVDERE